MGLRLVALAAALSLIAGLATPAAAAPKRAKAKTTATPPPPDPPPEPPAPPPPEPPAPPPPEPTKEPAKERKALRVAVYELKIEGVDPRVGTIVTDAIVAELRKLQRVSVVSMDEVRAMLDLEAQKQLVGCAQESCAAEIAEALGVDGVVIGNLANVGDENVFGLRRIDQLEARTLGQVSRRLTAAGGEEFLAAVGPAIEELFPGFPLRPGFERGVAKEVALRLNPPPLPPIVFWSTAGTTAVVGVAALGALGLNVKTWADNSGRLENATSQRIAATDVKAEQELIDQTFWASVVLGGGVAVGTASSVVVALFTDWKGYGEDL
jgi:hypothetical protein